VGYRSAEADLENGKEEPADSAANERHRQAPDHEVVEQLSTVLVLWGRGHAQRAESRQRGHVHEVRADVHRGGDRERVDVAELLRQVRHGGQKRRQDHPGRAAVDRNKAGREGHDRGHCVRRGDAGQDTGKQRLHQNQQQR